MSNWESLFVDEIPNLLEKRKLRYGKYTLSYTAKVSEFLKSNLVDRNKQSKHQVFKVDVKIENSEPEKSEFSDIMFENVPVAKIPILTDSGIILKGTRYFYVNEIKQADGWYILPVEKNDEDIIERADTSKDLDRELGVERTEKENDLGDFGEILDNPFENSENSEPDALTSDELDGDEEVKKSLDKELEETGGSNKTNKSNEEDDNYTEYENKKGYSFNDTQYFGDREDTTNRYGVKLKYRGPFARNLIFSISKKPDGTNIFNVQFSINNRKRSVRWFTFLKAVLPNLSAEQIVAKFGDCDIIKEAYVSAKHSHAAEKRGNGAQQPSIDDSSVQCSQYCLSEFFITKNGNKFLDGIDNPVEEFNNRLNSIRCNTEQRNKDLSSFTNFAGYYLREDLPEFVVSGLKGKVRIPEVGDKLSFEQLVLLNEIEDLDEICISKSKDSKAHKVNRIGVYESFADEIIDVFKRFLLVCEGIGEPSKMDSLKNKEIESLNSKILNSIDSQLFKFNESFCNTVADRRNVNSVISENVFAECFKSDINKGYKALLKQIHESSNYQGKDDTNSLAEYSQKNQLKYGVKDAPLSLRSLSEDQYGFICPQTTSEGGNVGLNLFKTLDTEVIGNQICKKFYLLNKGQFVEKNGEKEVVFLTPGDVSRAFVLKFREELPDDIYQELECYVGSRKTKARLCNIKYMELADGQNVSANLAIITGANNNGGKRGTMGPNQEKQSQPLLIPQRSMVDSGVFEHEDIGVIRAEALIKKALIELGMIDSLKDIKDNWCIELLDTKQRDYASRVEYVVNNSGISELNSKTFYYEIPTLAPTVKRSLHHSEILVNDTNMYYRNDIVIKMSDVDVKTYDTYGTGYNGAQQSNFGPNGGAQLRVAFNVYEGFGYEDALVINEDSVKSGKLAIVTYYNINDEIKLNHDITDAEFYGDSKYDYLDSNGIPKVGTVLGVGDVVISKVIPKVVNGVVTERVLSCTRLMEGAKDKGCVVASSIETYKKEDGFDYKRAVVSLMYISNPAYGTKFSGGHGNKGVISKIVPACMMPYDEEGNRVDLILNPTGSLPRNNLGQFTEITANTIGMKTNEVQLVKPFEKWDINELLDRARVNDVVPKKLYDGITGQPFDRDIMIGYMTIFRSEHDVKGKFNSCSLDGNVNSNTLTVSRGPGGGQRVGEMTTWALFAKGANKYLDSMFTVQGGDVVKKKEFKSKLRNGGSLEEIKLQGDNRLNNSAKMRYLMMGCIFEDFNGGRFKPLNNDEIKRDKSPFIIANSYDIENSVVYGSGEMRASATQLAKEYELRNARCIDLGQRIIYPIYVESSFLLNSMWYVVSTESESNALSSAVGSLISNKYEKADYVFLEDIKCLSNETIKKILAGEKLVIFVKGMIVPIVIKRDSYYRLLENFKEIPGYDEDKFNDCVKVFKGYYGILATLLGFDYDPFSNDVDLNCCKHDGNLLQPLVISKLSQIISGSKGNKFTVTSYNYGDYFKDLISFAVSHGMDENKINDVSKLMDSLDSKFTEFQSKLALEKEKDKEERVEVESLDSILVNFVCGNKDKLEDLPMLFELDNICKLQRYDLFIHVSCSYFWVPPKILRGNSISGTPTKLKTLIGNVVTTAEGYSPALNPYSSNSNARNYLDMIFRRLKELTMYCIGELKNHSGSGKNAILRDQVMSVRVNCSARGYITVDPTLGMDEVGLPIYHAAGMFDTFLQCIDEYDRNSYLYRILRLSTALEDKEDDTKNNEQIKKLRTTLFTFLSSDNKKSFDNSLRGFSSYEGLVKQICNEKGMTDKEARREVFRVCREELIKRLEELLEEHPISLERAPTFWEYSVQAFKGKLRFDCHSVALCPLVCKAFNADFDGDQMSQTIAVEQGAIEEQKELMFPSSNIINIQDGRLIQNLNQDMALGIYWLTIERRNKLSLKDGEELTDPDKYVSRELEKPIASYFDAEVLQGDIEMGVIDPHEYIVFRFSENGVSRFYKDTAGRILFNSLLPCGIGFTKTRRGLSNGNVILVDEGSECEFFDSYYVLYTDTVNLKCVRSKDLQQIGNSVAHKFIDTKDDNGDSYAKTYLERIMRLGFKMAHKSGVSLSLYDFESIINDSNIKSTVDDLKSEVNRAKKMLDYGFSTEDEYTKYLVSRFSNATDGFESYLKENLDRYSDLYLLIDSGARGSFKQLVTQSIMVGLPSDAEGNIIPEPIFGNYIEGLNSTEYFNTSYVAREALVTGSMYTGNIGEVLRTMVYQCDHNVIQYEYKDEDFCDADSVKIKLDYEVELPGNFDIEVCELVDNDEDNKWTELLGCWRTMLDRLGKVDKSTMFSRLLIKFKCKKIWFKEGSGVKSGEVKFTLSSYSRDLIKMRSVDVSKWKYGKEVLFKTDYSYWVVNNDTISVLEDNVENSINIYMAMNCKCKDGICRRCYGVNDLWKTPKRFAAVGIESAQSIGQIVSQSALDSHKSAGNKALSNFSSLCNILSQQKIGNEVYVAKSSGILDFRLDLSKQELDIYIVGLNGNEHVGIFKSNNDNGFLKYRSGEFIREGDVLYYDKTLNYGRMFTEMSDLDLDDVKVLDKCKLNVIKEIFNLLGDDLSLRHYDILVRDLTKFGVAAKTVYKNGNSFVQGGVYTINELEDNGIRYEPVIVSSLKSMQLNNKNASSMAMSYLRKQIGNAAVLEKKSVRSPLNCLLEGISLDDVYGEDPLSEDEIRDKYACREYGVNINESLEDIQTRFSGLKSSQSNTYSSFNSIIGKKNSKSSKSSAMSKLFDRNRKNTEEVRTKVEETKTKVEEPKTKVEESMTKVEETIEEKPKKNVRDRIKLHYTSDGKKIEKESEKKVDNKDYYDIDAEKTDLFS